MAGGVSGNLKPFWSDVSTFLNQGEEFEKAKEKAMKIFLAGNNGRHWIISNSPFSFDKEQKYDKILRKIAPNMLESFYYVDEDTEKLLPFYGDFLLDSGAFTFMQGSHGKSIIWDDYIERYADFINRNKVEKFFELDIDSVVGYERVLEFRRKLEKLTNRQCIPVWHVSRGKAEFDHSCDEYKYVAIGGIVSGEITKDKYFIFSKMIADAHEKGAKIHGLGFTNLKLLPRYHFDSVDSTAWTTGNRFGFIYQFNGETMIKIKAPEGHRLGDSREAAVNNFTEWLKFQAYADKKL